MGEIYEFLALGGPVMIPIGLGSIIALAIFLERLWSLQRNAVLPPGLVDKVDQHLADGKPDDALAICKDRPSPLGRVLETAVVHRDEPRELIQQRLEDRGRQEGVKLERYFEAVGTIAQLEPLLGLLGTVTGMIKVFQKIVATSEHGAVDPGQLAAGIWEALITTAAGLIIGIPVLIAHRYLLSRSNRLVLEMEQGATRILDRIKGVPEAPAKAE
ncbi:MAG: MotA/TolQ/ExbB proton channel family protein [Deltaproteobacteria bacterium]|nr:MotA/TolQ/ExbB proton channel family protein [Deltaproteobacteria bacterium]